MNWICYVAGKTGGHIIPGITLSAVDKKEGKKILFVTTDHQMDQTVMHDYSWIDKHESLKLGSISYATFKGKLYFLGALLRAFKQSFSLLRRYKPEKIISMGGYISLPVCYAAWLLRIPVIVYELNAVPGAAVKALIPCTTEVRVCFAEAQCYFKKSNVVEYPVRFNQERIDTVAESRHRLGLDLDKLTLFICGGSQGSRAINALVVELLTHEKSVQVIHQTGSHDVEAMGSWYKQQGVSAVVFAFRSDIENCYLAADRIIARAGAGSLFEILFFKKPALIIPLKTKITDHQIDNAFAMKRGYPHLFEVILQEDITLESMRVKDFLFK